jgi:hypothetical protein
LSSPTFSPVQIEYPKNESSPLVTTNDKVNQKRVDSYIEWIRRNQHHLYDNDSSLTNGLPSAVRDVWEEQAGVNKVSVYVPLLLCQSGGERLKSPNADGDAGADGIDDQIAAAAGSEPVLLVDDDGLPSSLLTYVEQVDVNMQYAMDGVREYGLGQPVSADSAEGSPVGWMNGSKPSPHPKDGGRTRTSDTSPRNPAWGLTNSQVLHSAMEGNLYVSRGSHPEEDGHHNSTFFPAGGGDDDEDEDDDVHENGDDDDRNPFFPAGGGDDDDDDLDAASVNLVAGAGEALPSLASKLLMPAGCTFFPAGGGDDDNVNQEAACVGLVAGAGVAIPSPARELLKPAGGVPSTGRAGQLSPLPGISAPSPSVKNTQPSTRRARGCGLYVNRRPPPCRSSITEDNTDAEGIGRFSKKALSPDAHDFKNHVLFVAAVMTNSLSKGKVTQTTSAPFLPAGVNSYRFNNRKNNKYAANSSCGGGNGKLTLCRFLDDYRRSMSNKKEQGDNHGLLTGGEYAAYVSNWAANITPHNRSSMPPPTCPAAAVDRNSKARPQWKDADSTNDFERALFETSLYASSPQEIALLEPRLKMDWIADNVVKYRIANNLARSVKYGALDAQLIGVAMEYASEAFRSVKNMIPLPLCAREFLAAGEKLRYRLDAQQEAGSLQSLYDHRDLSLLPRPVYEKHQARRRDPLLRDEPKKKMKFTDEGAETVADDVQNSMT